jgi:superfamily II DNA or RNA helicase
MMGASTELVLNYATSALVAPHNVIMEMREACCSPVTTYVPATRRYVTTKDYTMTHGGMFPTGLWRHMKRWLQDDGHTVTVTDTRVHPGGPPDMSKMDLIGITPLPFQVEAVQTALKAVNGIVKATTAAGKSACIFLCTQVKSDIPWIVLTSDRKVAAQLADEFERMTGEKAGRLIASGAWKFERVTFGTFSQLENKLLDSSVMAKLNTFKGLIVDEVHESAASTRMAVLLALQTYYRIGFSATPFGRSDGRNEFTIGAVGPQVFEVCAPEMIALGRVAKPIIRFVSFTHKNVRQEHVSHKWETIYKRSIVENKERNQLILDILDVAAKPALIFADRIKHGLTLTNLVTKAGYNTRFISGDTPLSTAEEQIKALDRNILDVIVTNKVMNAGVSIPNLASVIIASAGKAVIATVQRLGRPMRRPDGKDQCEYWDVYDIGECEGQSKVRVSDLKKEGHEVDIVDDEWFAAQLASARKA